MLKKLFRLLYAMIRVVHAAIEMYGAARALAC